MDTWLRRNFWLVILAMGSITVYFTSIAGTQLFAAKFLPLDANGIQGWSLVKHVLNAPGEAPKRVVSAKTILERNPFDSVTGPILDQPASEPIKTPSTDTVTNPSDMLFSPCSDGLKLMVTMVDPIQRERSFAVLGPGEQKKSLVREGSNVSNHEVAVIVRERVYLRDGTSYCYVAMFEPPQPPKAAPAPSARNPTLVDPGAVSGGAPRLSPEIEKGIQKIDDTNYNIDRTTVDKIIENQSELMRFARIVPEQENGKVVGIRMLNIRPETVLGKLGMQSGDVLKSINGFDMTSPEKALEAYAKIRQAPQIVVSVSRNGKPMNLDYHVK